MLTRPPAAWPPLLSLLLGCGGGTGPAPGPAGPAPGAARVQASYALPATSLKVLNPFLTDEDLTQGLARTVDPATSVPKGRVDAPGIGSGLARGRGKDNGAFWAVTDRGINDDHPLGGKTFPIPRYTPAIVALRAADGKLAIDRAIPLLTTSGAPATGLPNDPSDDTPYPSLAATSPLGLDVNGLDVEELEPLPTGGFLISEEYSPSLAVVSEDGRVKMRYTPRGKPLAGADYPVKELLPEVLVHRRKNRGFEAMALSADGRTAYLVMESPLGPTSDARYKATRVVRIVRVDVSNPLDAAVTGHFITLQSAVDAGHAAAEPGVKPSEVKCSAADWLGPDRLLVVERLDGLVKLFALDLSRATNLLGLGAAKGEQSLDLEDTATPGQGYQALGVTPAERDEVFSSHDTPEILAGQDGAAGTSKWEGLVVLGPDTVAVTNDNDFGIQRGDDPSRLWVIRLRRPLR
jgi:Esterase-like activity of phytase